jgi:glycine/D-amino acid oxidase-like deaminating enzyme
MLSANLGSLRGFNPGPATQPASSFTRKHETIIIGAGIAGLACARRLHDAGHSFLLISENVGGRIRQSPDGALNLGAYYVRSDYTHVNRYLEVGRRLDRLAIQRHDAAGHAYSYWDHRLLLHLPQAARFLRLLMDFRRRYNMLKQRTLVMGQAAAIRADPILNRLYHEPATDFLDEHRIGNLARTYIEPGIHGTTFTSLQDLTAFTMLLGALPVLVPAYEFTPRLDRLVAGFEDDIATDSVTAISAQLDGHHVRTRAHGTLVAQRVVIATPPAVAKKLLGLPSTKRSIEAHMFQVEGTLRHPYDHADINLFPATDPTLAIARQTGGAILLCSHLRHPDFDRYFASWRIVAHQYWDPAFHIVGNDLLECEQSPGLYLVGDHNIVGLEDAYLTGVYAANQIIAGVSHRQTGEHRQPVAARHSDMSEMAVMQNS